MLKISEVKKSSSYWTNRAKFVVLLRLIQDSILLIDGENEVEFDTNISDMFHKNFNIHQTIDCHVSNLKLLKKSNTQKLVGSKYDGFCCQELSASLKTVNINLQVLINRRMDRMCVELDSVKIKLRTQIEVEKFQGDREGYLNNSSSSFLLEYDSFPSKQWNTNFLKICLFDDLDLYDAIRAISVESMSSSSSLWSAFSVPLSTRSFHNLQQHFKDILNYYQHSETKIENRTILIDLNSSMLSLKSNSELKELAKFGCYPSNRPEIWAGILETDIIEPRASNVFLLNIDCQNSS
jgi:hypothetical protein